jgi:hypothetical protein
VLVYHKYYWNLEKEKNMIRDDFEKWMISNESKSENTAYNYKISIDRLSKHYSKITGKQTYIR